MKEAFYFTHDYNARNDERIISLRRKCKLEGYGAYWFLIEMLAENSEHKLPLKKLEDYAFEMRVECECIASVINDFDLFENDGVFFWSNRLLNHFSEREEKTIKARESAMIRWSKKTSNKADKNANALRTQCECNAIKERKGKEMVNKIDPTVPIELLNKKDPTDGMTIAKKFGNEKINFLFSEIERLTGLPPVAGKSSRNYAYNFLLALEKKYPKSDPAILASKVVECAVQLNDDWHSAKCNDPKHLFYKWQEIILLAKKPKNELQSF